MSPQDSVQLGFQKIQDALEIRVGLLCGEAAVVGPQFQVEGDAFFTVRDAGTCVYVKQGYASQQSFGAPADAVLQCAHGEVLAA